MWKSTFKLNKDDITHMHVYLFVFFKITLFFIRFRSPFYNMFLKPKH